MWQRETFERGRLALLQGLERGAYTVIELGLADVPRMSQILAKYSGADLADEQCECCRFTAQGAGV